MKLLSVDGQSLDSITHEEAVVKLTQTGQVVNLTVSRNRSTRISTSESLERLKTDDSTTSADSEVYEATVKGERYIISSISNFALENILNCSNISDCGVPESSVAQSALKIGCRIMDAADDVIHKERTGLHHLHFNLYNFSQFY